MTAWMTLENDWQAKLADEFNQAYMVSLQAFLASQSDVSVYPEESLYLAALNQTSFEKVKVVILGQDPYHGEGQAHGLSFSVKPGTKIPPSLVNMYKELQQDVGIKPANHGYLKAWAEQGVLLLNSVLTVEAGKAGSHQNKGWETFTDKIIALLNEQKQGVVFLLWGSYAQQKGRFIDRQTHCVLEAVHPSPLSAYRGFFGCGHFSKTNEYLRQQGKHPIEWALEDIEQDDEKEGQIHLPF
ncbi:uracil-DNA glycosylase [Marinomonas posidonica]|uniref:Uracil-DNA glycosylase n=1 Tax=Marinomonas posidonica (strain CECT 7376 / NCIMB 14433 / IVIA-Po-181) TaxID=491952 RepID=F6CZH5_MARPP|nr:uracil-DNA glycosylase [Marinomonas posidonica]AEF55787.1 Uracil-DNA glycosylase [Marinomonas posidonica IVIA-Po-181]